MKSSVQQTDFTLTPNMVTVQSEADFAWKQESNRNETHSFHCVDESAKAAAHTVD